MAYIKRVLLNGEKHNIMLKSILPKEMKGVMFISGYQGKGKSYLASQADFPQNIAFFDFEDKGEGIHNQLNFGWYKAISQEKNTPLGRAELLSKSIGELEQEKYTVAILDNISPLENALFEMLPLVIYMVAF